MLDLYLTWIIIGLATSLLIGLFEGYNNKEELYNSIALGVVGGIIGGFLGQGIVNVSFVNHMSPLLFALAGSFIFVIIVKNYPRML